MSFVTMAPARAGEDDSFLLRAKRVYTMAAGDAWVLEPGAVLVKNGRIAAVGTTLDAPSFVDVIDLPDAVVMPGLVAANTSLAGRHTGEESVGPRYHAADAFNPFADYRRILAGGVTTAYLNPARHRLIAGVGAVVKLGRPGETAVLDAAADLCINLGDPVFDPPPKQHWLIPPASDLLIRPADVQRPSSRLGQLLQLRESFDAAAAYAASSRGRQAARPGAAREPREYDDNLAALAELIRSGIGVRVNADRAVDIEQAIAFCRERKLSFVITGALQSDFAADAVAAAGAPVVFNVPLNLTAPAANIGPDPDALGDELTIPAALHNLELAVGLPDGASVGELSLYAAAARRAGLSQRKALEAVTASAARVLGVGERVGSIEPGRDADLLVLNGEPLLSTTHVRRVYVNGRTVFDADADARREKRDADGAAALVVKAGAVWTGERTIANGAVLIEDGRIVAVDETVPHPPHARVIDAGPSAVVTPGFIDALGRLGLEGDQTQAGADLAPADAVASARPEFARVARAGVTSVLVSSYRPHARGSRVSAIHTAGTTRDEVVVKRTAGLVFSLRGADPAAAPDTLKNALKAGKAYDDAWKKYEKDLAEFKARGPTTKPAEEKPAPAPEPSPEEKPKADPVTGTWDGEISGGPLPEPQQFKAKMKLSGDQVEGSIETFFGGGESVGLSGTFRDGHLSLELDVDIPIGKPRIEADIDREDHLAGELRIGPQFSFDIEATRTEKETPTIRITPRRGATKDGRPVAPKKDESLEPYRDLFAGRIAVVVDVDDPAVIEVVLPVFKKEYPVPFVLANAEGAGRIKDQVLESKTGVILPQQPVRRVNRRDYVQSIDLSRAGIPIAVQSAAEDAARALPDRMAYEVRRGLDATVALRALTIDAARMMKCDDEVGMLAPGRRGDLLVFDGPPLEPGSRLNRVIIDGKEVPQ